ncbi:MAG: 50S ribosomal protein L28 [Candidatus Buchananbacteria bacterium]
MSKICSVCGRGTRSANNVSHSNVKTKTTQNINLHSKVIAGKKTRICAGCIKTRAKSK